MFGDADVACLVVLDVWWKRSFMFGGKQTVDYCMFGGQETVWSRNSLLLHNKAYVCTAQHVHAEHVNGPIDA